MKRVAVTGLGIISPLGQEVESVWAKVLNGESGIKSITKFDASRYSSRIAGEITDFVPERWVGERDAKYMDQYIAYGVAAAKIALSDSNLLNSSISREEIGVSVSSVYGGLTLLSAQDRVLTTKGPKWVSPLFIPFSLPDSASSYVSIKHQLQGPSFTVASACATGANSLGEAMLMIVNGRAKAMVAGGADALTGELFLAGFTAIRATSKRNENPEKASRPFDKDRDGCVVSEGAAVCVLEEWENARNRGAKIYAELVGYGATSDAFHLSSPHSDGIGGARCIAQALNMADLKPEDIGYVNAHGTSTIVGDRVETKVMKRALGEHAYKIPVSSTKSMTGHMMGAAGAIEAIFSILSLRDNIVPPTINLDSTDADCDLDYVPHHARLHQMSYAMSNSFGFGGHNATLIFKKCDPEK